MRIARFVERKQSMTLQDFISEEALLRVLNLKRSTLDGLRAKGLPFISLGLSRIYSVPSLCDWFLKNERILNRGSRGEPNPTP